MGGAYTESDPGAVLGSLGESKMLTRKHFEAIATIIKQADARDTQAITLQIAMNLCHLFKAENPAFDRERFMRACGF